MEAIVLNTEACDKKDPEEALRVLIVTKTSVPFTTAKLTVGFVRLLLEDPTTDTLNCEFAVSPVTNEMFAPISTLVSILILVTVEAKDPSENNCAPVMDAEKGAQVAEETLARRRNNRARKRGVNAEMNKFIIIVW